MPNTLKRKKRIHTRETSQEIDKMTPNEVGSGMTDAEADAIINWFDTYANRTQVEVINGQVREVVADTNKSKTRWSVVTYI